MGGIANSRNLSLNSIRTSKSDNKSLFSAYVYDVVLDENKSLLKDLDLTGTETRYVGAIWCRIEGNLVDTENNLIFAYPDLNVKSIPVKNEIVNVRKSSSGQYYYERTGFIYTPNINSSDNIISSNFKPNQKTSPTSNSYSNVSRTGISRTESDHSLSFDGYGDYFTPSIGIHKLKLYEGDTLIESRFGQSLRFSGYNNISNSFSPVIILRNLENPENVDENNISSTTTEEDINRDGSIIVLSSNDYKMDFQPGTVDNNGSTDFETTPDSFQDYPTDLIGNQILLNSGRIIISAKESEMIFYSKKNYGFISDGGLSIDNSLGITATVNDLIEINTNDNDININTNNGKINLGNVELEPVVKGDTLLEILSELINELIKQQFATPSGPTAVGPLPPHINKFNEIKDKLDTFLSKLNSTS